MMLVKSRQQVADELIRLQRDNESLQGKHKLHVELQQQEAFQMPDTVQVGDPNPLTLDPNPLTLTLTLRLLKTS